MLSQTKNKDGVIKIFYIIPLNAIRMFYNNPYNFHSIIILGSVYKSFKGYYSAFYMAMAMIMIVATVSGCRMTTLTTNNN